MRVYTTGDVVMYFDSVYPNKVVADFYAIGSGNELALGAMAAGADARRAVEIAIMLDTSSGGEIHTMNVFEGSP